MSPADPPSAPPSDAEARLAAALRANLRRRKRPAPARADPAEPLDDPATGGPSLGPI
jgi:hypothetical protein